MDNKEAADLDIQHHMTEPCKECGSTGACGYDSEGRPYIHINNRFWLDKD